ncbi:hypothetical protein [Pseudomonas putida]|uniref:Uncharacterized protein n=1 Tax=Pseudomonas putida TaxID=303 RepID=A0A8I1ED73_PSEPU|nr:hypothetical protein [Pseudomonas putida]MBI6883114.1 hypothetical protein [Pseudomonas putida]
MFDTDAEKISRALLVWANHIETGNVALSAVDMGAMGKKVKAITPEQVALITELRELSVKALQGKIIVRN